MNESFFSPLLENVYLINLIFFIIKIIIDLSFALAIFTILAFFTPNFLSILGIDINYVAAIAAIIAVLGIGLVEYILIQLNIPIGLKDLLNTFGLADKDCQWDFFNGMDFWRRLFNKCE